MEFTGAPLAWVRDIANWPTGISLTQNNVAVVILVTNPVDSKLVPNSEHNS